MQVGVLGLGEAGSRLASDLVAAGARVVGYDIRGVDAPAGVQRATTTAEAVAGADLVLSLTTAQGSIEAVEAAAAHLGPDAVYADMNASSPARKQEIATLLPTGLFADVAILAPIARAGIRTPLLACGSGADRYAELLRPLGAEIDLVDGEPGAATSRKLLRSVFMKSLATSVIEALTAAHAVGCEPWLRAQIESELGADGPALVDRLVSGTFQHARRRTHEMEDTRDYLDALGRDSDMTRASLAWLSAIDRGDRVRTV